jgi:iron complex outermembrane receptor protein
MFQMGLRRLVVSALAVFPLPAFAADFDAQKLLSLSLAELSNIEVTSVSKKAEPEKEAAAAIFVITQEDIKRSGATAIPEILRMAPGITVTKSASNNWTVTSRGFNDQFSNKLLVLIDGRTVYSPLFSGVIWDEQDTMLDDIERIEVIRGPGATLWGANAVNGVINIITKNSKDTQGGIAQASLGNQLGIGSARYGVKIGDNSYVRTYAKYTDYNSEQLTDSNNAGDSWRRKQAGFRSDVKISGSDKLKIQGDIYTVDEDNSYMYPDLNSPIFYSLSKGLESRGGNILARWEQKQNKNSETSVQAYFDNAYRKTTFFNDDANTFDMEFQHIWTGWKRQEIVWGIGYRFINSNNDPSAQYFLTPDTRNDSLYNAFLQDKIALLPERLFLTLGSKFEHNDYSGVEIQPSARLSWLIDHSQTLWGSVSRAVHTPSRFNSDGNLYYAIIPPSLSVPLPTVIASAGNRDLDSEKLISYELGYRIQPSKTLSLDLSAYYNDYSNLLADTVGTPVVIGSYVYQPLIAQNVNKAHSLGYEAVVRYNPTSSWQLVATYSYINLEFADKAHIGSFFTGKQPKNMFNLRSTYLLPGKVEMTNSLYAVSKLSGINIPGYMRFDTRFSYPLTDNVEISLVGQNLLDSRHKEFSPFLYQSQTEIGRSIYASASLKF